MALVTSMEAKVTTEEHMEDMALLVISKACMAMEHKGIMDIAK